MLSKVSYNREVTKDGDYVTGANIYLNKSINLLDSDLHFNAANHQLRFKNFTQNGHKIHIDFMPDSSLSTLTFNTKDFVNCFSYPQIKLKIDDLGENSTRFLIDYQESKFIADFTQNIYQSNNGQLAYYKYCTGTSATKRPLVIFLHGSGERGFENKLPLLGNDVPKVIHDYIKSHEDSVLLVPQASWSKELNGWFRPEIQKTLIDLIKNVVDDENIDCNRIYLLGVSNGGAATRHFAERYPTTFAAIVPCCGYIYNDNKQFLQEPGKGRYMEPTSSEAARLKDIPIWAFHAEDDLTVDVKGTRDTIAAVKAQGNKNAQMTIFEPGQTKPDPHASWKLAFHNDKLLPWLFKQHK